MDIDDIIKIDVRFDQPEKTYEPESLVRGTIIVTPYRNIGINKFEFQPVYHLKASWQDQKKKLNADLLASNQEWKGGVDYEYPFSFKVNKLPSYQSEQLFVQWMVTTTIELNASSRNEIRTLLGKKFQFTKMANPDKLLDKEFIFQVKPSNDSRSIAPKKTTVHQHIGKKKTNGLLIAAVVMLIIGFKSTYMVILALFLGYQGFKKGKHLKGLISKKVAGLSFQPFSKDQFKVILELGSSYRNLKKVQMNFKINEEVGSYAKNAKSIELHQDSQTFEAAELRPVLSNLFDYPEDSIPTSIKINGYQMVKFNWHIELIFHYTDGTIFKTNESFKAVWDKKGTSVMAATL